MNIACPVNLQLFIRSPGKVRLVPDAEEMLVKVGKKRTLSAPVLLTHAAPGWDISSVNYALWTARSNWKQVGGNQR